MSKLKELSHLIVKPGKAVDLGEVSTDSTRDVPEREKADERTTATAQHIGELQDALYAQGRQSLLVILQGMDASGKDGSVRKVFDAVNPTGIQVTSFKQPSAEELRHDFLWRCHAKPSPWLYRRVQSFLLRRCADRAGACGSAVAAGAARTEGDLGKAVPDDHRVRADAVGCGDAGGQMLFCISRGRNTQRFVARQKDPSKHWKLAAGDFEERKYWDDYQRAYEKMLPATSSDHITRHGTSYRRISKWVRNYHLAHLILATLQDMNPVPPVLGDKSLIKRRFK